MEGGMQGGLTAGIYCTGCKQREALQSRSDQPNVHGGRLNRSHRRFLSYQSRLIDYTIQSASRERIEIFTHGQKPDAELLEEFRMSQLNSECIGNIEVAVNVHEAPYSKHEQYRR